MKTGEEMNLNLDKNAVINVLLYAVVIGFLLFSLYVEYKDINCTSFRSSKCGVGCGSAYAAGKPSDEDSVRTLLSKIRTTCRYEVNSIIWRRAFIAAVIGAFLVTYVGKGKMPTGLDFASAFLILYIIFYMILIFFQKSVTAPALSQIDKILDKIKEKIDSDSHYK